MRFLRTLICDALKAEIARIEGQRGAWSGRDADNVSKATAFVEMLEGPRPCFLEIRQEQNPWEIKL